MFKPKLFSVYEANFTTRNVERYLKKTHIRILLKCNTFARILSATCEKQTVRGCNDGESLVQLVLFDRLKNKILFPLPRQKAEKFTTGGHPALNSESNAFDKQFLCHLN